MDIDHDEIIEESNTPSADCQRCVFRRTEYVVEFRDLLKDTVRTRSLCRQCCEEILEDI